MLDNVLDSLLTACDFLHLAALIEESLLLINNCQSELGNGKGLNTLVCVILFVDLVSIITSVVGLELDDAPLLSEEEEAVLLGDDDSEESVESVVD